MLCYGVGKRKLQQMARRPITAPSRTRLVGLGIISFFAVGLLSVSYMAGIALVAGVGLFFVLAGLVHPVRKTVRFLSARFGRLAPALLLLGTSFRMMVRAIGLQHGEQLGFSALGIIILMILVWAAERYGLLAAIQRIWARKNAGRAPE